MSNIMQPQYISDSQGSSFWYTEIKVNGEIKVIGAGAKLAVEAGLYDATVLSAN